MTDQDRATSLGLLASWRRRRLERARLRLLDELQEMRRWSFAYTPSREAQQKKRIQKAEDRFVRLGGTEDTLWAD